jgi:hypothetical protein
MPSNGSVLDSVSILNLHFVILPMICFRSLPVRFKRYTAGDFRGWQTNHESADDFYDV